MKVFIDARMTKTGGTYSYTVSLLEEILKQDSSNNEYFVLYNKGQKQILPDKSKNFVTGSGNPIYWVLWDNFVLPQIIQKHNIDIFHSFKRPNITNIKTKKIITIHSAYHFLYPEIQGIGGTLYWSKALKRSAKEADEVIAVSHTDAENLMKCIHVSADKLHVTQLAANERFNVVKDKNALRKVKKELGLPDKFVVYVGTIYPVKNVKNIVRVYSRLKDATNNGLKLVIVGRKGWGLKVIHQIIKELQLEEHVTFTGHQSDYLPHIYTLAELLLFPSYYEAFCAPPLESMACGTPVVASTQGGVPEVVGKAGLLNDPDDIEGLTESCLKILSQPRFRKELVKKGFKQANSFSWAKCAQKTVAVYEYLYDKAAKN